MDTPKTKPDMMAASPRTGGGKRILAALEHGGKIAARPASKTSWTIDSWTVSLGLLLLLMFGVAWMMHEETITPSTFKHSDGGDRQLAAAPHMAMPSAPAVEQAAAIVNESLTAAEHDASQAEPVATPARLAVNSTQPLPAQSVPTRGAPPSHKPAQSASSATARNTAGSGAAAAATSARDTDITLLTALVAHANKPTVTVAERSRDVVERKDGDTTAQLLARCQQLGLIEGMLCRSRICSDRWDADAACRAPAH